MRIIRSTQFMSCADPDAAMPLRPKRIAVLFHKNESPRTIGSYAVDALAKVWRSHGHEVIYLFGTRWLEPADLLLVHVNLSVVPLNYLSFARRYPIALNAWVGDIRKTRYSGLIVRPDEPYDGPVIMKTDLNYGGYPEMRLGRWRALRWLYRTLAASRAYRVYPSPETVPAPLRWLSGMVMERFRPERDGNYYVVRSYQFLGDCGHAIRLLGRDPEVKGATSEAMEPVDPHPQIVQLRRQMYFDYGKFDYVEHDGQALLLDANKTTGGRALPETPELLEMRRTRAEGLYWYFHNHGHWSMSGASPAT